MPDQPGESHAAEKPAPQADPKPPNRPQYSNLADQLLEKAVSKILGSLIIALLVP